MVYDAKNCRLYNGLWDPNFQVSIIDSTIWNENSDTWFGDTNLGEHFFSYCLDEELRQCRYMELNAYFDDDLVLKMWTRILVGLRLSPFVTIQPLLWGNKCIRGYFQCT